MTIHKSQGQSFDKVGVYLHNPIFVHGQLYMALSRVRHADGLKVYIANNGDQNRADNNMVYTRNVVCNVLLH
ncbi:DNA helicase PIF1/RRM3 [Trachipleistophora hominis]|uniref:DNA helicase PIF1/RRM3 n=1 Tax=Trachipleistophora hominis TaxID=72359 RepID=L7JS92_TRAHO|nr:DNA helicase PIF1/RRM3 [Trachipleistophora hominis]